MNHSSQAAAIHASEQYAAETRALIAVGEQFYCRGWSLATSSNYSVLLGRSPFRLLVTASGKDKSQLSPSDFVIVDSEGNPSAGAPKPSAETLLHVVASQQPGIGAVLHTHSIWGTLLSDVYYEQGAVSLQGYEMAKGLVGVSSHEHTVDVPIFENTQDIPTLAEAVRERFDSRPDMPFHAFLIRRHGMYTWGRDLDEARRHVEALEFLFEVAGRELSLRASQPRA